MRVTVKVGLLVVIAAPFAVWRFYPHSEPPVIPLPEQSALRATVQRAEKAADAGHVYEGYRLLMREKERVEAARDAGASWGEALVRAYCQELEYYQQRQAIRGPGPRPRSGTG